jgi:hypothetical protein
MTFQFKIQIKGITLPPVWRRVSIPSHFTFAEFHYLIQSAFEWENCHLFQFSPKGWRSYPIIKFIEDYEKEEYTTGQSGNLREAEEVKLSDIFFECKQKYTYIYDFGDNWEHTITLEKISEGATLWPNCLAGKGVCPPEDCGGVHAYKYLKEVLKNPKDPEYENALSWCLYEGQTEWDPAAFNLKETQQLIRDVFTIRSGSHN